MLPGLGLTFRQVLQEAVIEAVDEGASVFFLYAGGLELAAEALAVGGLAIPSRRPFT